MKTSTMGMTIALLVSMAASASAVVITDTFSASSLDPVWVLDDEPASYLSGGFAMDTGLGVAGFNNVGNNAFAHIRTATTYDTTGGIRADAIMTQNSPINYLSTWGMGVSIYFDTGNWVSIKQCDAGGQYGWMRDAMLGGVRSAKMSNFEVGLRNFYLISGIELTNTEIKFYGSSIDPRVDMYGVTNIDANASVIPEFTMARPAGFTGQASVIIGKGYSTPADYSNPYFNNSTLLDNWGFTGIDYARITVGPATPAIPGDFDADGDVDGADFVAWQSHFPTASGAILADGDADADGDVDGADFVVWQSHFPTIAGPGLSSIPEPGSLTLIILTCIAIAPVKRRFCSRYLITPTGDPVGIA